MASLLATASACALAGCGAGTHGESTATTHSYAYSWLKSPHVLSGYSTYTAKTGQLPAAPRFAPVRASQLTGPIDTYRAYAVARLGQMQSRLGVLRTALADDDRAAAESAWRAAYSSYLRLGAVYLAGEAASLNRQIDGTAGGLPGGVANAGFGGLHRIEYGLWTGAAPSSLLGVAGRLATAVGKLRRALPNLKVTPLEYVTRAHEILEDAQRDLLSGADVPWSGEGVLGTAAGLAATEEVLATLHSLLVDEESVAPVVEAELAALRDAFAKVAAAHGGRLPSNDQLSQAQTELLDGALGGALEALSAIPEELETEAPPQHAEIPSQDVRIDP